MRQQRRAHRNEIRLAQHIGKGLRVDVLAFREIQHLAHVDNADDIVEAFTVDGQTGMVADCDLAAQFGRRRFDVDRFDLVARRHCIFHGDRFQVEEVQ